MVVAIPLFGSRVSPRFLFAQEALIATTEEQKEIERKKISTVGLNLPQRLDLLANFGVNTLICGGIENSCLRTLSARGFQVIHSVVGEADDALQLFLQGKLKAGQFIRGKRKRFRGGRNTSGVPPLLVS
jgi:predicted Fe-Mo cluster-binding NifX family protein